MGLAAVGGDAQQRLGASGLPRVIPPVDPGLSRRQGYALGFYRPMCQSLTSVPGVFDVLVLLAGLDPLPGVRGLTHTSWSPASLPVSSWSAAWTPFLYPSPLCAPCLPRSVLCLLHRGFTAPGCRGLWESVEVHLNGVFHLLSL